MILEGRLRAVAPGGITLTIRPAGKGVITLWCTLADPHDLRAVAALVKALGGRLSTITALPPKPPQDAPEAAAHAALAFDGKVHEIAYHFDLDGNTLTVTVLPPQANAEIESLTPLFRNADWSEREFMETCAIRVLGHPHPQRLFLDESVDPAVLERLIPFFALVETREIMQDVKETLFGNRMDIAVNCIGGVRYDLDADGTTFLATQLDRMDAAMGEIDDLYRNNHAIRSRTRGVGVLSREDAIEFGVVGLVAWACGMVNDVRSKAPYAAYDKLDVTVARRRRATCGRGRWCG
jgi:hypothetical protein